MFKVEQLKVLFPQFDNEVLQSVLEAKSNSIDDAVDALLAMDSSRPKNPNDPDLHVGALTRASRRTQVRKRLRQARKARNPARKRDCTKKVKWVRFSPFVTAIAKEPLKDDNSFNVLADEDEDRELEEEFRQLLLEEEGGEKPVFSFSDFPPLCTMAEDSSESDFPLIFTMDEDSNEKEEKEKESCEKQVTTDVAPCCSIESSFFVTPFPLTSSLSESLICQLEKKPSLVAVKLYFSYSPDIHRLAVDREDPSAFDKLCASIANLKGSSSSFVAPKYVDEEKERITVRTQEEWEECIRVHETFIWPAETQRSVPILRLYL